MERARRHQKALARVALIFLALCAEPVASPRLRPPRRGIELLGRRLLPDPARRREGRPRVDARAACLALRQGDASAPDSRCALPPNGAHRALAEAVALLLPRDVADLPRTDGRRGDLDRPLALARAVAAHRRPARLRRSLRRRGGGLPRRRAVARGV